MSTSSISTLAIASQQVTIYLGLTILIAGCVGGVLNIIVFLSLKTFRKSSCAFYLTAMSFANIMHLSISLLPQILIYGFGIDLPSISLTYCKFRVYFIQLWILTSFTCMCLATLDQFLVTYFNPFWHRCNNIKFACYILAAFFLLWLLHGIPFAIYFNITLSPITSQLDCLITNDIFAEYNTFGYVLILMGVLPLIVMVLFGSLAYYNVRHLAYRAVPVVRRELDKQLTQMVLVQVIYNCFVLTPYIIVVFISIYLSFNDQLAFTQVFVVTVHNFYFAVSRNNFK
jgi:hypothetical protein